jgi:NADPH:quinone reductase-like Zn-dependent oxidoreductase
MSGGAVLIALTAASANPIDWKVRSGSRQKKCFLQLWAAM